MGKELTDRALLDEMRRFLGLPGTVRLLGYATYLGLAGVDSIEGIRHTALLPMGTRYKVATQFLTLRKVLLERGYELEPDELVQAVVSIRPASA